MVCSEGGGRILKVFDSHDKSLEKVEDFAFLAKNRIWGKKRPIVKINGQGKCHILPPGSVTGRGYQRGIMAPLSEYHTFPT